MSTPTERLIRSIAELLHRAGLRRLAWLLLDAESALWRERMRRCSHA